MGKAVDTTTTWRIGDGTAAFYNIYIIWLQVLQSMTPLEVIKFEKVKLIEKGS